MEVCEIVEKQQYARKLNKDQTTEMIRMTSRSPGKRRNEIDRIVIRLF